MDQAALCSFETLESWVTKLFNATQRAPPKGYSHVSLAHVVNTDREFFSLVAQEVEGQLQVMPGSKKPLDSAVQKFMTSDEVVQFLTPLPSFPPPPPHFKGGGKAGKPGKGKGDKKGGGKAPRIIIPDGCSAKDAQGRPHAVFRL